MCWLVYISSVSCSITRAALTPHCLACALATRISKQKASADAFRASGKEEYERAKAALLAKRCERQELIRATLASATLATEDLGRVVSTAWLQRVCNAEPGASLAAGAEDVGPRTGRVCPHGNLLPRAVASGARERGLFCVDGSLHGYSIWHGRCLGCAGVFPCCLLGKPNISTLFAAGRRISEQAWQSFLELAGGVGTHDEAFRIDELCRECLATE